MNYTTIGIIILLALYCYLLVELRKAVKNKIIIYLENKCVEKIKHKFDSIEVRPGYSFNNQRCHVNSLWYNKREGGKIAICYTLEDGSSPIAHFINCDNGGYFIDNTLGELSHYCDYYLIEIVKEEDYHIRRLTELLGIIKHPAFILSDCMFYRVLIKLTNYRL